MSKYDYIVPYGDEIDELEYGVLDSNKSGKCCICGESTTWIESYDGKHICSEECMRKFFEQIRESWQSEAKKGS